MEKSGDILYEKYIKIKEENQEFKIERKNISQIKTVYNWD